MKFRVLIFLLLLTIVQLSYGQAPSTKIKAKSIVQTSLHTMGDAWRDVHSVSLEGYGYRNDIDQSERPEGPYIPGRVTRKILKDYASSRFLIDENGEDFIFSGQSAFLINGTDEALKSGKDLSPTVEAQQFADDLNLSPELVLNRALDAPDLKFVKDTIYQKAKHWIITFSYNHYPVRVFLNQETKLLTVIEITRPYQNAYFNVWGDMKKTRVYSFWMLLGKGLHYPVQQDTWVNGYYEGSFVVNHWKVNPELNADTLAIPDSIKAQSRNLWHSQNASLTTAVAKGGKELAPGVWLINGPCNNTIINQPDGLVVIEAPFSSEYGEALISKAKTLFPGKKIKALVSTSDAWMHIGGARPFAAIPGIKIYHPYRNRFILDKLFKSSYKTNPDALAKTSKPSYTLHGIADTLSIGSGNNKLVLYAYRTETGDRQMMVYYPHYKMLYTTDHYQPKRRDGTYWNNEIVSEVYHSILDRKLDVKQFYAMHSRGLIPFEDMEKDVKTGME